MVGSLRASRRSRTAGLPKLVQKGPVSPPPVRLTVDGDDGGAVQQTIERRRRHHISA